MLSFSTNSSLSQVQTSGAKKSGHDIILVEQLPRAAKLRYSADGSSRAQLTGRESSENSVVELEHLKMFVDSGRHVTVRGLYLMDYVYEEF